MKGILTMIRLVRLSFFAAFLYVGGNFVIVEACRAADTPHVDEDGTIHVPAFLLPESAFLSQQTRAALKRGRDLESDPFQAAFKACPLEKNADRLKLPVIRQCQAAAFYETSFYKSLRAQYPVALSSEVIRGVNTEVFTPVGGIAAENRKRLLINLHGGGFFCCARMNSHLESIPIASIGKIKVISIDYRQAPEYTFPAASEDVAAVYQELLKTYKPKNIGVYGCSSGGALTAQAVAWFQMHNMPLPGAVGMFCSGAERALDRGKPKWMRSDSAYLSDALGGQKSEVVPELYWYYEGVDRRSPLASPGDYDEIMAKFPPSLLISGTRDPLLSSVLVTHAQLVRLGVDAELHVWEGMSHAFNYDSEIPESREAFNVIVGFFAVRLGR